MSISQPPTPPPQRFADGTYFAYSKLSRNFKKSQHVLNETIAGVFRVHPVERVLLVTLTFAEPLRSVKESHRRLNSLLNKIRQRYPLGYLWVLQPQEKSGRIHYHLLIPVPFDAHEGSSLGAWEHKKIYTDDQRLMSMSSALRTEHEWWSGKAESYGFGRIEVAPIYSNADFMRRYLIRQDWRNYHWPFEETKAVQFWRCSRNFRCGNVNFRWHSPKSTECRRQFQLWAADHGCSSPEQLRKKLGRNYGVNFIQHLQRLELQAAMASKVPQHSGRSW